MKLIRRQKDFEIVELKRGAFNYISSDSSD